MAPALGSGPNAQYVALITDRIIYPGMELTLSYDESGYGTAVAHGSAVANDLTKEQKTARDYYLKEEDRIITQKGYPPQQSQQAHLILLGWVPYSISRK